MPRRVPRRRPPAARDALPDVRDGLTRLERAILFVLADPNGRSLPTATLYGRVLDHVDVSQAEFQEALGRLARQRR